MRLDEPARVHVVDIIELQPVRGRQDNIRHFRHRPPELVELHQEVDLFQGLDDLVGGGHVDDLLAADADPDADGFFALIEQPHDGIGITGTGGTHLELITAVDVRFHFVGQGDLVKDVLDKAGLGQDPADHAARPLDVAGNAQQVDNPPQGLAAVGLPFQRAADLDAAGSVHREKAGGLDNLFLRHPGNFFDLFHRVFRGAFFQGIEAVGPVLDELFIPKAFLNDNVNHAQGEGGVRAGAGLEPKSRPGGISGGAGVDDDQVFYVVQRLHVPVAHLGVGAAYFKLLGPGYLRLGEHAAPPVIVAVKPAVAGDKAVKANARAMANIAGRDNVGGAHRAGEAVGIAVIAAAGTLGSGDGMSAVLLGGLFNLGGDSVQRLVPADLFPLSFPLFPRPFIGMDNAVGIIDVLDAGEALGAHRAAGSRIGVALDVGDDAIGHFDEDAAAAMAGLAGGFNNLLFSH